MANPAIRKLPEGTRDPNLGFDAGDGLEQPPVEIGEEDWRDWGADDGEQDSDDALSLT